MACFVSLWLALSRYGLLCLTLAHFDFALFHFVSLWLTFSCLAFALALLPLLLGCWGPLSQEMQKGVS